MYSFIYRFFYCLCEKFKTVDPIDNARAFTLVMVMSHLFFFANLFTAITGLNPTETYSPKHKYYHLPFVVLFIFLGYRALSDKRGSRILQKADSLEGVLTWRNTIVILLLLILPVILGIKILNDF